MYAYVHTVMHMFVLTNWLYNEYNFMRHKTKQRQQNNRPSPTLQARFEGVCVCAWTGWATDCAHTLQLDDQQVLELLTLNSIFCSTVLYISTTLLGFEPNEPQREQIALENKSLGSPFGLFAFTFAFASPSVLGLVWVTRIACFCLFICLLYECNT